MMTKNWTAFVVLGILSSCGSPQKSDLQIAASPGGEVTELLQVVLDFSRPMVASKDVGEPLQNPPLSFSPAIEGEARWQDEDTLVFVATTNLAPSTGFVGTVPKGTKALDGNGLAEGFKFEFTSTRLQAEVEIVGSEKRARKRQGVKLSFNQEVPFEQVADNCHYAAQAKKVAVVRGPEVMEGPAKSYVVMPKDELSLNADWTLRCTSNLRGVEGNLGMTADAKAEFHTYGPLAFLEMDPKGNDIVPDEDLRLELAFTNPLKEPYKMELSPKVPGFPGRCYSGGDAPPSVSCGVMLEPNTAYTLTIAADQLDIFDQKLAAEKKIAFRTADSKPTLSLESGYFVAELKRPVYPVWTRNVSKVKVTALKVTPGNFHKLSPLLDWWDNDGVDFSETKLAPVEKEVEVAGTKNKWHQYELDPKKLLKAKGPGMYYFEVAAPEVENDYDSRGKLLVNFTDIGVVTKMSSTRGLVWATKLSTGKPLPGAKVSVRNDAGKVTWTGTTDAEGLAVLPGKAVLMKKPAEEVSSYSTLRVFVSQGSDWTMVDASRTGGLSNYNFNVSTDYDMEPVKLRGFMHTDRGLYRPGETVHIKGLGRTTKLGSPLQVPAKKAVTIEVRGPRGNTVSSADLRMSRFGGFWTDVEIPADARLGDYTIRAELANGTFTSRFSVEEYRPATFEVTGKAKNKRVVRRGKLDARVAANYFYGAPVRNGELQFTVHSRPRTVRFPQHEGFSFYDERSHASPYYSSYSQELVTEDSATLDSSGAATVNTSVSPSDISSDADLLVRASVTAPSNEVVSKTFTIPYFRSRRYHGIKAPGYFLEVGKKQKFEVVAVNPSGKRVSGKVKLTVRRRDWNCVWEDWGYRGSYQCKEIKHDILSKTLEVKGGAPTSFEFTPKGGGEYWVVVEGEKESHAAASTQLYAWGDDGGSWRSDDSMTFDVISDKKEYKAGDTATLILKTDLSQATGLVTIERDGVLERRLVEVTPKSKHLQIPITAEHAPNVYVSVALVQGRMGKGPRGKPRMRMGMVNLPVRPEDNTLSVSVETEGKDYRPGDEVKATVKVTDASGKPVAAEVALTAADEGVLSLIAFKTPNPIPTFYAPWGLGVMTATQYAYIKDIPGPNTERPATGGDSGGPGSIRSRFVSTAVWKPGIVTNAAGVATVSFKAPDNLTAFRVMAVAADKGYRFGSGEQRFTVSKPLQLHRALPRFVTLGDELEAGVVVHNETDGAGRATVKVQVGDALEVQGALEKSVDVPKGGRVPVLFAMKGKGAGEASLTFSVAMGSEKDAVLFKLPVHHPSPEKVLRVAHGVTKAKKGIAIELPKDAIVSSARIHVSVDPDGLAGIENGLRDLVKYPYGCLEQTTSKVIPMIAVRDLAETLDLGGLKGKKLEGFVKQGIAKIGRHQTAYGGFSLWPGGRPQAYYTAYALWGLHLAKKAGFEVDQSRIKDGLSYLRSDGKRPNQSAPYYSSAGNYAAQAFALYVRAMLGDKDTAAAAKLTEKVDDIPVYGRAFLARALAAGVGTKDPAVRKLVEGLSSIAGDAVKSESLIAEPNEDELWWYMSDSRRTTAIVIDTLVELDPKNEAIKPLVRALMTSRRKTRYMSTQANLYSLLALTNYARSLSGRAPSVNVSVGDDKLILGALRGKQRVKVASIAAPGASSEVVLQPRGEVNYSVEVRYRQKPETLKKVSNTLSLTREYLDEKGAKKTSFKVGDVVVVRLTMPLDKSKNHLMVSDRLPAGFEALNTKLATVGPVGERRQRWGSFRELRDERVDFSAEYTWKGEYKREYMVRAIAQGRFVLPPSVAELMYEPDENAQTALGSIEIKAK